MEKTFLLHPVKCSNSSEIIFVMRIAGVMERTVESVERARDLLLLRMKNADFLLVELLNRLFWLRLLQHDV